MTGWNTRVAGTTITASAHNTDVRDQVVSQFATIAARDAAIVAPSEGMVCVTRVEDVVWYYNGSAWVNVNGVSLFADAATRNTAWTLGKAEGWTSYLSDVNSMQVYTGAGSTHSTIGPVHGALTAWTPAVTQLGSVTVTNNGSFYTRTGRWVHATFILTVTGSGTGANDVSVSLPVNSAFTSAAPITCGNGELFDTSASSSYLAPIAITSATVCKFRVTGVVTRSYLGSNTFTAALAVNDTLIGTIEYEAAADA